jgi:hypothetical protein
MTLEESAREPAMQYSETDGIKKGRGRAQRSLDLIETMYAAAKAAHPITGRGIGYKLFTGADPFDVAQRYAARLPPS